MNSSHAWLMKSEPSEYSIDDLAQAPMQTVPWVGVRNYQARNYMRDTMRLGDRVYFYHSSCPKPGIVGLARVASAPYPDPSQYDPQSPYFDPKAILNQPRWFLVDVCLEQRTKLLSLAEIRACSDLATMVLLKTGNRLSISPVSAHEYQILEALLND